MDVFKAAFQEDRADAGTAPKGKTNTYASSDIMIGMLLKGPIEG